MTDALSQVLHIDFQSVMEGNHPSIDIKPLVDAWNDISNNYRVMKPLV
ncbi:hypothetical protein [Vibrio alginolyticus]|nr:hypothetical protein [Vibrio alginolyticus]